MRLYLLRELWAAVRGKSGSGSSLTGCREENSSGSGQRWGVDVLGEYAMRCDAMRYDDMGLLGPGCDRQLNVWRPLGKDAKPHGGTKCVRGLPQSFVCLSWRDLNIAEHYNVDTMVQYTPRRTPASSCAGCNALA
jgi:hypothetical protein